MLFSIIETSHRSNLILLYFKQEFQADIRTSLKRTLACTAGQFTLDDLYSVSSIGLCHSILFLFYEKYAPRFRWSARQAREKFNAKCNLGCGWLRIKVRCNCSSCCSCFTCMHSCCMHSCCMHSCCLELVIFVWN